MNLRRRVYQLFSAIAMVTLVIALLPTSTVFAASAGPFNAGTGANVSYTSADDQWSNTGAVTASDNNRAQVTNSSSSNISYYLEATDFGFAIPAGSIINGIEVSIERSAACVSSCTSNVTDYRIRIIKGGNVQSTDRSSADNWPSTDAYKDYGSISDLWGTTWTSNDINASDFGVAIATQRSNGGDKNAYVDNVQITVTYTIPTPSTYVGDGTSPASKTVTGSATNQTVSAFSLYTNIDPDTVTSITVTGSGTGVSDVAKVKLWEDDGSVPNEWDATDTQVGTLAGESFGGTTATFSGLSIPVTTSAVQYLVTYDIIASPTNGHTIEAEVSAIAAGLPVNYNDNTDATLTVDTVGPNFTSSTPIDTATNVDVNSPVTINWNENVDCTSVTTSTVTISSGGWDLTSCSGNHAVFTPSSQGTLILYTVTIGTGVTDLAGNHMASEASFSFTTGLVSETFSTSGTWYAPEGVTSITVEVWGGGGGGGADTSSSTGGAGGGGGGAYARINSYPVTPGNSYSYTVGSGGSGGQTFGGSTNGGNGQASWFVGAGTLNANGGSGGSGGNYGTGGSAGSAGATGDAQYRGGYGSDGINGSGGGGGGSGGNSGAGNYASTTVDNASGATAVTGGGPGGNGGNSATGSTPSTGPGGGGGGGEYSGTFNGSRGGGSGRPGQIIITYSIVTDNVPPTATIDLQAGSDSGDSNTDDLTNAASPIFDVEFDEAVTGFSNDDLFNAGTAAGCAFSIGAPSGNIYPVTVNSCGEGTLKVRILANHVADLAGNFAEETDGPVVTIDRTAPSVTDVSSEKLDGTYGVAVLITVDVYFSEDFTLTGSPKLTLDTGDPATTVLDYGSRTDNILHFDYTTILGNYSNDLNYAGTDSFDLNGGSIHDAAGNYSDGTLPATGSAHSLAGNKEIVILTVTPPVAVNDSYTVIEDASATTFTVLSNDTPPSYGTWKINNVTQPDHGTVVITNGGLQLTYKPDPDYCNNGSPTDNFTYVLTPGGSIGTVFVTVTCVNDAPVNTLPGNFIVTNSVQSPLSGVSVFDVEGNIVSTQLTVTSGVLHVTVGAATISAGANDSADMTISGNLTQINAALATLKFTGAADATLSMLSKDTEPLTDYDEATIDINEAPVVNVPGAQFLNINIQTAISGVSISDVNGNVTSAQMSVGAGTLHVTLSGAASISSGANDSSSMTISGTQADINATLASLKFTGNTPTTLTVYGEDSLGLNDSDTVAITINHYPVNTVPGAMVITKGFPNAISGVSVADSDNNLITTQLSAPTGVFQVTLGGGATISAGANGTNNLTLSGNQTQINAALATLTFNPSANTVITVLSADDNALTDSDTINITANNPPVAVNDGYTVYESADAATFNVLSNDTDSDGNGGNPALDKKIASVTQPANGTVVIAGDKLSLTYKPVQFYCNDGNPKDTFTYTLQPGNSTATVSMTVTCIPSPTITSLSPNFGSDGGGTNLTITGTNFAGSGNDVLSVKFGLDEYSIVTTTPTNGQCRRTDNTHIACRTAAHTAEIVDVEVTTRGGIATKEDAYQFVHEALITSISINIGPTIGGTPISLAGTDFMAEPGSGFDWKVSLVKFGGNEANCTVDTPTHISCVTPAHPAGLVNIDLTNPGGTSTNPDWFTYVLPSYLGVFPNHGPTSGGTSVTLQALDWAGAESVEFDGIPVVCIADSGVQLRCTSPAHSAGMIDIVVLGAGDVELHHFTDAFTYIAPVTNINPNNGPTGGGTYVEITGTNFTGATSVTFGGIDATEYTVVSSTKITAITAPNTPGLKDVVIKSPGGGTMTMANAFAFIPPVLGADVYPNFGPTSGGTYVRITGKNFNLATDVEFGDVTATSFKILSDTTIEAYTPAHDEGTVDVKVNLTGSSIIYPDAFTYTASPVPFVHLTYPAERMHNVPRIPIDESASKVTIKFSNLMNKSTSGSAEWPFSVYNPNNYMLVMTGPNKVYDTVSCFSGLGGDDKKVKINYINDFNPADNSFIFWLNDGYNLNEGNYRLFVCGTTSIKDATGVKLNAGLTDSVLSFYVANPEPAIMPETGFAPSRITELPAQTTSYDELGDLWIEIPRLKLQVPIVGVQQFMDGTWDVTWLGDKAGWLEGTAFPSFSGNSVLTGHVYTDKGVPGPFYALYSMYEGDTIIIHAYGTSYQYIVREVLKVDPKAINELIYHKDTPWLTLTTCLNWNEGLGTYDYHLLIRAEFILWWSD